MNNQSKRESNPFKDMLLVFFIVGSIIIASLGWIFYGEIAFKIILSFILLFAAILYMAGFIKKRKSGHLIAALFFLTAGFTFLVAFYLPGIYSLISALISLILFVALITTFYNMEKYY